MSTAMVRCKVWLICISFMLVSCSGNLFETKIMIEKPSHVLLDVFEFTQAGGVELNVSEIDISFPSLPVNHLLNLSTIGFFIVSKDGYIDDYVLRSNHYPCFFQKIVPASFFKVLYNFEQLKGKDSVNLEFKFTHQPGVFGLYFQNCLTKDHKVSMKVRSAMYNVLPDGHINYLSASEDSQFPLLVGLIVTYIIIGIANFICYIFFLQLKYQLSPLDTQNFSSAILLKIASISFELLLRHYIKNPGAIQDFWIVLLEFMSPLFHEIAFLKLFLLTVSPNFMLKVAAFCQFALAVWKFIRLPHGPCDASCATDFVFYRLFSFLPTILVAYLSQVWSVRRLLSQGLVKTESALRLRAIGIKMSVVFPVLGYIYFMMFVNVAYEGFHCSWIFKNLSEVFMFRELTTIALFIFLGYKVCFQGVHILNKKITAYENKASYDIIRTHVDELQALYPNTILPVQG